MISDAALEELRARNPVTSVATKWVALRRGGKAGRMVGPCPVHSIKTDAKDATAFECWSDGWVCARCQDGGDVIRLVMLHEAKDFLGAVEWLGGAQQVDPDVAERRAREQAARKAQAEATSARFREEERKRLYRMWRDDARPLPGTPAEQYLALRGVAPPPGAMLRAYGALPRVVYDGLDDRRRQIWRRVHVGPAMLAAIVAPDGHFAGLQIDWIDLSRPKGKALIVDDKTGEVLEPRIVRGSKAGNHIELLRCANPTRLFIGEGVVTCLTIYAALLAAGRPLDGTAIWSAVDLGNLAGKAADGSRLPHPSERTAKGRVKHIPGPEPDPDSPAVHIPDSVVDLRLLGDADSDPFTTRLTMQRAERRHARPGRRVVTVWPATGHDFNSMVA